MDAKQIAAGYHLVKAGEEQFDLMAPDADFGSPVVEIGWSRPFIMARGSRELPWKVIDTSTGRSLTIPEEQRRGSPEYREIEIYSAPQAWKQLRQTKRQW